MRSFDPDKVPHIPAPPEVNGLWSKPHIDFEIGAGQGLHAIQYSLAHPDRVLIAVERTHEKFTKAAGRFENHGSPANLVLLQADAIAFAVHHIPAHSLENIFLLYPNPYPKQKQANLRWHNSPAMGFLLQRLKAHGQLTLATNLEWYATEAKQTFTETWGLKLKNERQLKANSTTGRTHFERKYLERGETCHELVFQSSMKA